MEKGKKEGVDRMMDIDGDKTTEIRMQYRRYSKKGLDMCCYRCKAKTCCQCEEEVE